MTFKSKITAVIDKNGKVVASVRDNDEFAKKTRIKDGYTISNDYYVELLHHGRGSGKIKRKKKSFKRPSRGLAGTPVQHEIEAFKHMTALPVTCGEKGLVALLNAQTALVHAHESGNTTLAARALKRRNEVLKKLERCMR